MSTFSPCQFDSSDLLDAFFNVCLADASPLTKTQDAGLVVAVVVLAFAIWQIRVQFARVRLSSDDLPMLNEKGRRFFRRRSLRRLQLACLSFVVGTAILVGSSAPPDRFPRLWTSAWICVLFFGLWVCALAVADAIITWLSFSVERDKNRAEQILLKYKIEKFRENSLKEQENANDAAS